MVFTGFGSIQYWALQSCITVKPKGVQLICAQAFEYAWCPVSSGSRCVSLLTAIMIIFMGSSASCPGKSDPVTMHNLKLNSHPSRSGAKAHLVCL
jgi:hypothetical protein